MARLLTTGFETRLYSTSAQTNGEGQSTACYGSPSADQTNQWVGSTCMKVDKSANEGMTWTPGGLATNRWYYAQFVWKADAKSKTGVFPTVALWKTPTSAEAFELLLDNTTGEFEIWLGGSGTSENTGIVPTPGSHYILEMGIRVPSSGTEGKVLLKIRNSAGSILYEKELTSNLGTSAPTSHGLGPLATTQTEANWYYSQWVINDDQGANENGEVGFQKVTMLAPTSDKARTGWVAGGAPTTEKLFEALDAPPVGVAPGSSTHSSQIKDAENNATDTYQANLQTYTAGGIGAGDAIKAVMGIFRVSNNGTTSRNLGLKGISNPEIAEATKGTITTTAGTEPVGWSTGVTGSVYAPAVTKGEAPVLQVRKATATTNIVSCDLLGLYVSYEEKTSQKGRAVLSGTGTLTAQARAGKRGKASLSGSGTLTSKGRTGRRAKATLIGIGTLIADGVKGSRGKAVLSGKGELTASGKKDEQPTPPLEDANDLTSLGGYNRINPRKLRGWR